MYFITVFERINPSEYGFADLGDQRTWGYYEDKATAIRALHENWTHMFETCYWYAVIEKIGEGICSLCEWRQWFKYDKEKDGYFEIEEPEAVKHLVNFAIG